MKNMNNNLSSVIMGHPLAIKKNYVLFQMIFIDLVFHTNSETNSFEIQRKEKQPTIFRLSLFDFFS